MKKKFITWATISLMIITLSACRDSFQDLNVAKQTTEKGKALEEKTPEYIQSSTTELNTLEPEGWVEEDNDGNKLRSIKLNGNIMGKYHQGRFLTIDLDPMAKKLFVLRWFALGKENQRYAGFVDRIVESVPSEEQWKNLKNKDLPINKPYYRPFYAKINKEGTSIKARIKYAEDPTKPFLLDEENFNIFPYRQDKAYKNLKSVALALGGYTSLPRRYISSTIQYYHCNDNLIPINNDSEKNGLRDLPYTSKVAPYTPSLKLYPRGMILGLRFKLSAKDLNISPEDFPNSKRNVYLNLKIKNIHIQSATTTFEANYDLSKADENGLPKIISPNRPPAAYIDPDVDNGFTFPIEEKNQKDIRLQFAYDKRSNEVYPSSRNEQAFNREQIIYLWCMPKDPAPMTENPNLFRVSIDYDITSNVHHLNKTNLRAGWKYQNLDKSNWKEGKVYVLNAKLRPSMKKDEELYLTPKAIDLFKKMAKDRFVGLEYCGEFPHDEYFNITNPLFNAPYFRGLRFYTKRDEKDSDFGRPIHCYNGAKVYNTIFDHFISTASHLKAQDISQYINETHIPFHNFTVLWNGTRLADNFDTKHTVTVNHVAGVGDEDYYLVYEFVPRKLSKGFHGIISYDKAFGRGGDPQQDHGEQIIARKYIQGAYHTASEWRALFIQIAKQIKQWKKDKNYSYLQAQPINKQWKRIEVNLINYTNFPHEDFLHYGKPRPSHLKDDDYWGVGKCERDHNDNPSLLSYWDQDPTTREKPWKVKWSISNLRDKFYNTSTAPFPWAGKAPTKSMLIERGWKFSETGGDPDNKFDNNIHVNCSDAFTTNHRKSLAPFFYHPSRP